ncbi:uncharacterized protein LOC104449201 [Eucalyptus grandis]|uniref:uncharacterized protein LOC104449201 n=1 Tax=Eucalyptus grandis TaxID=71139 RepID=UPI00192F0F5C|nr:uncharacterized protein LOC104449201 [Eucalyptus grandis]XP_039171332.1 uncharacterized protein LOC104449201 [Eucalyptus grandis]
MDSNAYTHSSYPDSGNSSPRSRDVDLETASWDDPVPNSYRVRFMCSYGGQIQPRSHDNQLAYVGGETKILAVDRGVKFAPFMSKLSSLCGAAAPEPCFKYQLPGEDLDALISVTNDEDLEHMMLEYDRLCRASAKPARLRLFLFPETGSAPASFADGEGKAGSQWFVDALNSVQMRSLEGSPPPESAAAAAAVGALNPDFLFGLEKGFPARKLQDPPAAAAAAAAAALDRDVTAGSDCGSEDRHVIGEPVISQAEIHRQIQELRRMQIAGHEQVHMLNRKMEDAIVNPRAPAGDYYGHRPPEKVASPAPAPVGFPVPMQIPANFPSERHMTSGTYSIGGAGNEQPVYYIQAPAGNYMGAPQGMRPGTGQPSQGPFYGMQRAMPDIFREQPVYNAVPQAPIQQQQQQQQQQPPKLMAYSTEGIQVMQAQPKVHVAEPGFPQVPQVMYDGSGRQVYYTAMPGSMAPPYQAAGDGRQGGGAGPANQEGKVVGRGPQSSSI